jgi:hypothetical protein
VKGKILNILLIFTSLIGYLEWGGGHQAFLFQAEAEVVTKIFSDPASILHPLTILPMFGQVLLFITLFQRVPGKLLTYTGIVCLGLLLSFMFVIGLISLNFKIILSTIPFLVVAAITIRYLRGGTDSAGNKSSIVP